MIDVMGEGEVRVAVVDAPATGTAVTLPDVRPLLRGTLHGAIALLAPAGLVLLLLLADSPRGYVGAAVFATSMMLLYTTSASYHLAPWPARARRVMMRLDHSMIFVLIAGTYTPFCLLAVGDAWGIPLLAVVWTLAGLGVLLKLVWPTPPRWVTVALYMGLGWTGAVAAWPLIAGVGPVVAGTLLAGGLVYSLGSVVYALRWPDPWPRWFGFHEVFHSFVVVGTGLHFVVIAGLVSA